MIVNGSDESNEALSFANVTSCMVRMDIPDVCITYVHTSIQPYSHCRLYFCDIINCVQLISHTASNNELASAHRVQTFT